MITHRFQATLTEDGTLTLSNLPFHAGESVEVILIERPTTPSAQDRYPLRGIPIEYVDPTEPVADADWEALQFRSL
jgi:hypothetical protein